MLGSHNSCTYLPCKKWWMYLINWTSKCQSESLSEQFLKGVRYFDIRVKYDRKAESHWIISHGLVEYKADINDDVLNVLNNLAAYTKENVYVRFLLEYNKIPDDFATKVYSLKSYLGWARGEYPSLTFHVMMTKWNEWEAIKWKDIDVHHAYSSILGWKRFLWVPYWYARFHNKKTRKERKELLESTDKVLLMDYINV